MKRVVAQGKHETKQFLKLMFPSNKFLKSSVITLQKKVRAEVITRDSEFVARGPLDSPNHY